MSDKHQALRLSTFVLSQGPGSVLETPSGPVVISSLDKFFTSLGAQVPGAKTGPEYFEVTEQRLTQSALDGARIVRLPTNDEVGVPASEWVYPTAQFPLWAICTKHGAVQVLYHHEAGCSRCDRMKDWERRAKAGREAVRFVRACEAGHLDDVDWNGLVHGRGGCRSKEFIWEGAGRSLRLSVLKCAKCTAAVNFGSEYMKPLKCMGRRPELGIGHEENCDGEARIVQRGASNLHVPVHQTALTIGETSQRLHELLNDANLRVRLEDAIAEDDLTEERVLRVLNNKNVQITPAARHELLTTPWGNLHKAIREVFGLDRMRAGDDGDPVRDVEFEFLSRAAVTGVPAVPAGGVGAPPLLEIHKDSVRTIEAPYSKLGIRVTPINRLRVVIAQTGYERLNGKPSDVSFQFGASKWVPGVELFGEGIFIDCPDNVLPLAAKRANDWRAMPRDPKCETDPVFVWWHTLAHRLLRSLSVDSGYSSAAIRERVYLRKSSNGDSRGGVLLYTVQPGGDGTLGGLVEMAKRFEEVLEGAVEDLDNCSNDPLCEESELHNTLGAVCYSCLLASETSCEWRNRGLDRLLLRDCLP
jgi:hypothetical protein